MNKIILVASAIVAVHSNAALAENPYVGEPPALAAQDEAQRTPGGAIAPSQVDRHAPASVEHDAPVYRNGSAHRFGDASPSSYK